MKIITIVSVGAVVLLAAFLPRLVALGRGSPYRIFGASTWAVAPEPGALLLVGASLVGLATLIRRRLRDNQKR
jgi:hypothetical protein